MTGPDQTDTHTQTHTHTAGSQEPGAGSQGFQKVAEWSSGPNGQCRQTHMSIRGILGSSFVVQGSCMSTGSLGGAALAAVAGFGSAGTMLDNAAPDQV